MDLKELGPSLWFLHIIDEFTRFSNAAIIRSKIAVIKKFLQCWISLFGALQKVISDNGGEFDSNEFRDLCENFNITVKTTPAYSPWSNGLCEKHNHMLAETVLKVKEDNKCDWETALAWSVCAKNSLISSKDFSPYQLVLGRNVNLPTVLSDKLPALEGQTERLTVAEHLSSLHLARKAFIMAESSEKIQRALHKQTRQTGAVYTTGDEVYYKRSDNNKWKGPAKVIGQDGPVVFIHHGGQLVKAHICRIQSTNPHKSEQEDKVTVEQTTERIPDQDDSKLNSIVQKEKIVKSNPVEDDDEEDEEADLGGSDELGGDDDSGQLPDQQEPEIQDEMLSEMGSKIKLKRGQVIQYSLDGADDVVTAKVLGRAGKSTGKYKNSYNVEYKAPENLEGTHAYIDLDRVTNFKLIVNNSEDVPATTESITEEIFETKDVDFSEAKMVELQSWKTNEVYEEVPYENQKCISVRWVCGMKSCENGYSYPKARLVARGFEDNQNLNNESPTCSKDSFRVINAIVAQKQWKLNTIDIKTPFL